MGTFSVVRMPDGYHVKCRVRLCGRSKVQPRPFKTEAEAILEATEGPSRRRRAARRRFLALRAERERIRAIWVAECEANNRAAEAASAAE